MLAVGAHANLSTGVLIQTHAPNSLLVSTPKATFPLADPADLAPVASEIITQQLTRSLAEVLRSEKEPKGVFVDELEEAISISDKGLLRLSIPAPYDAVHASIAGREESYDSRTGGDLYEWAKGLLQS